MINHFYTCLMNRLPSGEESLFPVYVEETFRPSAWTDAGRETDDALFGEDSDVSLRDYRFYQFFRLLRGSGLEEHLHRYDSRDTYFPQRRNFTDAALFMPSHTPEEGLSLGVSTEQQEEKDGPLRRKLIFLYREGAAPSAELVQEKNYGTFPLEETGEKRFFCPSLGLSLAVDSSIRSRTWEIDSRTKPARSIERVIEDTLALPAETLRELFDAVREDAPEYEDGFRTVTDTVFRFCMILLAQAVRNGRNLKKP
jgi:hypothetical protein